MLDADVELIRKNRHVFKEREWQLYALCASTGMRREEAYQINREYQEDGIRYVIIRYGKTEQFTRRVPLPYARRSRRSPARLAAVPVHPFDHPRTNSVARSRPEEFGSPDAAADGADRRDNPWRPAHPAPSREGPDA